MKRKKPKMYTVRYYVMATSLMDARRKAKKADPDEIYINQEWQENGNRHLSEAIGYHDVPTGEDEWEAEEE